MSDPTQQRIDTYNASVVAHIGQALAFGGDLEQAVDNVLKDLAAAGDGNGAGQGEATPPALPEQGEPA